MRGGTQGLVQRRALDPRAASDVWELDCAVGVARIGLEVLDGGDAGAGRTFERERITIGSHESSDFVLHDATVSRMHCELVPGSGCVVVRDLDSRHGTSIHGVAIKEATVTGTTLLQLGHARIRLVVGGDTVRLPLFDGARLGQLVGQSPAMRRAFAIIERAASSDAAVLIHGEPGTGKQAAAAAIHELGPRAGKPLLVLDCSAPRDLVESELFGHEHGSAAPGPGLLEAAAGGSVVFASIGDLPVELQPKLVTALERREVRRLGGTRTIPIDVRAIATTSRSLGADVNGHRFRSDLHHRLAAFHVALPPLRAHLDDLPLLVAELAQRLDATADDLAWLGAAAMQTELAARHWPGNVRELRGFLESCLAVRAPAAIDSLAAARASPGAIDTTRPFHAARADWTAVFDRAYAGDVLRRHLGNVAAAARAAGLDRLAFHRLLRQLGIK